MLYIFEREIRKNIEDKLADMYLEGELNNCAGLTIDYDGKDFVFSVIKNKDVKVKTPKKVTSKQAE